MEWQDELTLIAETAAENRVNKNGFAVKPEESARTVFCNKKTVGYSEYFKSQQTGIHTSFSIILHDIKMYSILILPDW